MKARILSALVFANLSAGGFGQDWPKAYSLPPGEIIVDRTDDSSSGFTTPSYQITSPAELSPDLLNQLVRTAESVAGVLQSLPLPLYSPPEGRKPTIAIFTSEASYRKAGGAPGTAGYYDGRKAQVLLQWEHFRPKSDPEGEPVQANFELLVHELTHLGMHRFIDISPPWLTEGVAEYLAATHTSEGNYDFTKVDNLIRDRLKQNSPANLQSIPLLELRKVIDLNSRSWHRMTAEGDPFDVLKAYKSSLLLTHFYFHGGSERRDQMKSYLRELAKVDFRKEERPSLIPVTMITSIQAKLTRYWAQRGVKLDWQ